MRILKTLLYNCDMQRSLLLITQFYKTDGTAIFIMVVSPAVLVHDVSASAGECR